MKIIRLSTTDLGSDSNYATSYTSLSTIADTADSVTGSFFSNQPGTLLVEQSGNGTNWDINDSIAITANTGAKINVALLLPYVRLRFTPSGSNPTTLRVFAQLASAGVKF